MSDSDRIHGFDTLRAFALLLGILLHALMPYISPPLNIWFVLDANNHVAYSVLMVAIHAFRLQTFFLLAGFFSSLLIKKRGLGSFIKNRVQRILVPFVISVLVLVPCLQALMVTGYSMREGAGYVEIGLFVIDCRAYNTSLSEFFSSGKFVSDVILYHIWFLYYLLMIYVAFVSSYLTVIKSGWNKWLSRLGRWLIKSKAGIFVLAIVSSFVMWPMRVWQADTPYDAVPDLFILAYYFLLFVIGVALHQNSDLLASIKGRSGLFLVGALTLFPIVLILQTYGPMPSGKLGVVSYKPLALITYNLFTWLTVFGLVGGFGKWFSKPNRPTRLISETAYWQYLMHLPLLVAMQIGLSFVDWPSIVEIFLQVIIAFFVLYSTYIWVVGRTFVGRILNGRRVQELE